MRCKSLPAKDAICILISIDDNRGDDRHVNGEHMQFEWQIKREQIVHAHQVCSRSSPRWVSEAPNMGEEMDSVDKRGSRAGAGLSCVTFETTGDCNAANCCEAPEKEMRDKLQLLICLGLLFPATEEGARVRGGLAATKSHRDSKDLFASLPWSQTDSFSGT